MHDNDTVKISSIRWSTKYQLQINYVDYDIIAQRSGMSQITKIIIHLCDQIAKDCLIITYSLSYHPALRYIAFASHSDFYYP